MIKILLFQKQPLPTLLVFHSLTKFSPFKMLYGREPALPSLLYLILSPRSNESHETYVTRLAKDLIKIQTLAYENVVANTQDRHQRDQVSRRELPTFDENKKVYFYAN